MPCLADKAFRCVPIRADWCGRRPGAAPAAVYESLDRAGLRVRNRLLGRFDDQHVILRQQFVVIGRVVLASTGYHLPSHSASEVKLYVGKSPYHSVSSCRAVGSQMPQNRSSIKIRPGFSFPGGTNDHARPTRRPERRSRRSRRDRPGTLVQGARAGRTCGSRSASPIGAKARDQKEETRDPRRREQVQRGLTRGTREDVVVLDVRGQQHDIPRQRDKQRRGQDDDRARRSFADARGPAARQPTRARRAGTAAAPASRSTGRSSRGPRDDRSTRALVRPPCDSRPG